MYQEFCVCFLIKARFSFLTQHFPNVFLKSPTFPKCSYKSQKKGQKKLTYLLTYSFPYFPTSCPGAFLRSAEKHNGLDVP